MQRIKSPPTLRLALGSAAHTAIERDLDHKLWTDEDLPLERVQDEFRDEFMKEAADAEDTEKESKDQALDSGVRSVATWHQKVAPTIDPIMVEEPLQYTLNGVVVTGTLDTVVRGDRIKDWKFTAKSPSTQGTRAYMLNLGLYAIGFRHKTGRIETGLDLEHIVRTKEPKHVTVSSDGPVPDKTIETIADIVEDVADGISRGVFLPTGLNTGACSWCGFQDRCPAYRAAYGSSR